MNIYTPQEAAEILKVSKRTILDLIRKKEFPAKKIGGQWRISEDAIKRYLTS